MSTLEASRNQSKQRIDLVDLCAENPMSSARVYFRLKGLLDRSLALLMLIPGLPLIGALILVVRATSPGPGIYRQVRVGRNGKTFSMYKIRTMRQDAEAGTGAVWTQNNDPRITRVGSFLRKVHLDELPQLFNVLRGDMSLMGPRPERPEFVFILAKQIPGYTKRLAVLPGVSGLSQINLPPDSDLNSVRRKQILDLEYIQTAGLWLDLRMMFCTSLRLTGIDGTLATRLTFVQRPIPVLTDDISHDVHDELADESNNSAMTPDALTSASLRETVTQLNETLSDDQGHFRHQLEALLSEEASGSEHRATNHFTEKAHDGNGKPKRTDRMSKGLRVGRPR